jgi:hypothetical protein
MYNMLMLDTFTACGFRVSGRAFGIKDRRRTLDSPAYVCVSFEENVGDGMPSISRLHTVLSVMCRFQRPRMARYINESASYMLQFPGNQREADADVARSSRTLSAALS